MDDLTARLAHANRLIDQVPQYRAGHQGPVGRLDRLCSALTRALPATGVGVSLLTDDNVSGGTVAASDPHCRELEDLQFALGEGPSIEAYALRRPILEPDLRVKGHRRWPGFAPAAHQQGVRAVFAFPLQMGAARAGALGVYRAEAGSLLPEALTQAVTFADVAMDLLVDGQARTDGAHTSPHVDDAMANRLEVFQAQGMVMVDLGVGIEEAMARLRAHAYAEGRALKDVAQDVVAGKLRLDRDTT